MPLLEGFIHRQIKAIKAPKTLPDPNEKTKVIKQWMVQQGYKQRRHRPTSN